MVTPETHGAGHEDSHGKFLRIPRRPVKRSFVRAMKRLHQTGFCVYRGHIHAQPSCSPAAADVSKTQRRSSWKKANGPRLSCITWNCGGLSTEPYHEFLYWLSIQQIDVCLLQGTRWSIAEPWQSCGYVLLPTPQQAGAHDGLLTFVRAQFCPASAISHATILEGRIQRVRCHLGHIGIDLVNCYQRPNNPAKNRLDPIKARSKFWHTWEDPLRNLLITAGDFNCTLDKPRPRSSCDAHFPDRDLFQAVVTRFSLASVKVHDAHPTFTGPDGQSNIDYIFARRPQLDQLSRRAHCIRFFLEYTSRIP